jgi:hypothetical protein
VTWKNAEELGPDSSITEFYAVKRNDKIAGTRSDLKCNDQVKEDAKSSENGV